MRTREQCRWLGFVLLLLPCLGSATAGQIVEPGAAITALVADPGRSVFYLALEGNELLSVDARTGEVDLLHTLTEACSSLEVADDGTALFAGMPASQSVAILDLPTGELNRTESFEGRDLGPSDLAWAKDFLYASFDDGIVGVNLVTGERDWFVEEESRRLSSSRLVLSRDERWLLDWRGNLVQLYERCEGRLLESVVRQQCLACTTDAPRGSIRALLPAADGHSLYAACEGRGTVSLIDAKGCVAEVGTIPVGEPAMALALSSDSSTLVVGRQESGLLFTRLADSLPFLTVGLIDELAEPGLAMSSDDRVVAAVVDGPLGPATRLELVRWTSLAPNVGGVRLKPVDDGPWGGPVMQPALVSPDLGAGIGWLEVGSGTLGIAPLPHGIFEIVVEAASHDPNSGVAGIVVGEWADAGVVLLTRSSNSNPPHRLRTLPSVRPGQDVHLAILGRRLTTATVVRSREPTVIVNAYSIRDWSRIDVDLTLTAGAVPGLVPLEVDFTDRRTEYTSVHILGCEEPGLRRPGIVSKLRAVKAPDDDLLLTWADSIVSGNHDAAERHVVYRALNAPDSSFGLLGEVESSPEPWEEFLDTGALSSEPPFAALHFYSIISENSVGTSGEVLP